MSNTTYNGWTNHATWAVGLHLMDSVIELIQEDGDVWSADDVNDAAELFKEIIAEMLDDSGIATFPLLWELLDTNSINYDELGQHALDAVFN